MEEQQNPDGSTEAVLATVIPDVEFPRILVSFDPKDNTVVVKEVKFYLLLWTYKETHRL